MLQIYRIVVVISEQRKSEAEAQRQSPKVHPMHAISNGHLPNGPKGSPQRNGNPPGHGSAAHKMTVPQDNAFRQDWTPPPPPPGRPPSYRPTRQSPTRACSPPGPRYVNSCQPGSPARDYHDYRGQRPPTRLDMNYQRRAPGRVNYSFQSDRP